jgi:uncharacterized protein
MEGFYDTLPGMRSLFILACCSMIPLYLQAQVNSAEPIIDMHLHASPADGNGPPPVSICAPYDSFSPWDPQTGGMAYAIALLKNPTCSHPLRSAMTQEELMNRTLQILREQNIIGLTSGPIQLVTKWKAAGGDRILPATGLRSDVASGPTPEELRQWVKAKEILAFAEMGQQYTGVSVTDPAMEPYYALAEELDVPMGIHMGPGPSGLAYFGPNGYRMRLSSLLLLEDVLVRHPKLRVWAMHAGWPLLDDAVGALYAHPQLYVDVGVISYAFPKKGFYSYLQRLVDAGFENRIMFGSDQMVWPDAIPIAIQTIKDAPFLTPEQKRDILYNNAARFLRLKK